MVRKTHLHDSICDIRIALLATQDVLTQHGPGFQLITGDVYYHGDYDWKTNSRGRAGAGHHSEVPPTR